MKDASDGLNLECLIKLRRDNIPGAPIVCEGPEGRPSSEGLGLSPAKLPGMQGLGAMGGATPTLSEGKPGQGTSGQSQVGCRLWGHRPQD